jgi:hypothetical protein
VNAGAGAAVGAGAAKKGAREPSCFETCNVPQKTAPSLSVGTPWSGHVLYQKCSTGRSTPSRTIRSVVLTHALASRTALHVTVISPYLHMPAHSAAHGRPKSAVLPQAIARSIRVARGCQCGCVARVVHGRAERRRRIVSKGRDATCWVLSDVRMTRDVA